MHESPQTFDAQARLLDVVDGDTFDLILKVWHAMTIGTPANPVRVRLSGIDTHELHFVSHDSEEYQRAVEERDYAAEWLSAGVEDHPGQYPFRVESGAHDARGSFGRPLVTLTRKSDGAVLNDDLLEEFGEDIRWDP